MTDHQEPEKTIPQMPPQLDKLAAALSKAQAAFPAVPKTGKNPFLKNEYATLDDIIGAVRKPLGANGLSFVQLLGSNGEGMTLRTILLHESGQMLDSVVTIGASGPEKGINALQSAGKSITYMKRYMLGAMLGVATDGDTDGEDSPSEAKRQPQKAAPRKQPAPDNGSEPASDGINNPRALLDALAPLEYFDPVKGLPHLLNTIKKQTGYDKKSWPTNDPDWYASAYDAVVEYVTANKAQDVIKETADQAGLPF